MSSSPKQAPIAASLIQTFEYRETDAATSGVPLHPHAKGVDFRGQDLERLLAEAKAQGAREGLQQALQKGAESRAQDLARITDSIRHFEQQANDYYSRVEVELVHLALAIAAKILHREAHVDRMLVGALAKIAIEKLQQGTKVTVLVNPGEVAEWKQYLQGSLSEGMKVDVKSDGKVEPRNCVLDTELGQTEIGIEAQLKEVERGFFDLLAQRPDNT